MFNISKIIITWLLAFYSLYADPIPFSINKDNSDGTITDQRTKLVWQKCSIGQKNDGECSGNASDHEWEDAVKMCDSLKLSGKKWRLPTIEELTSLTLSENEYSTESVTFPNTPSSYYWSSTKEDGKKNVSWYRDFSGGKAGSDNNSNLAYVRCVTGNYRPPIYVDNKDGTVTDKSNNLTWQKCSMGQKNDRKCSFSPNSYEWDAAIDACNSLNLADKKWRLPTLGELQSLIIKIDRKNPYLNTTVFPNSQTKYWTSDTVMCTNSSYFLELPKGKVGYDSRDSRYYFVRCVAERD